MVSLGRYVVGINTKRNMQTEELDVNSLADEAEG